MGSRSIYWLVWVIVLAILAYPIFSSFQKFLVSKDYDYLIEAECDPVVEICFYRDCSVPDDCPPNGLENYKVFYIKAADFPKCSNNSCKEECENQVIECAPVICGESEEDICTALPL